MGSDIYGVFQKQTLPGIWLNIETEYAFNCHYLFFAFIGDVRNGYGSLGCKVGQVINSLLANKGLPDDMCVSENKDGYAHNEYYPFINPYNSSYSWFLVNEYLDALNDQTPVIGFGLITKHNYLKWLEEPVLESGLRTRPRCTLYADRFPKGTIIVNDNLVEIQNSPNYEYVRVEYLLFLKEEFQYFTDEVNRLIEVHGTDQIRFVYGFG